MCSSSRLHYPTPPAQDEARWERLFAFGRTAVDGMVFEGYLLEGLVMRDVAVAACVFALLFEVDLVEPCRADAVAV